MIQKRSHKIGINGILGFMAMIWIFPVGFAVFGSLKGKQEYNLGNFWELPESFKLIENLKYINSGAEIYSGMMSSFLYAFCGSLFAVILAMLAAYAISHLEIKHRMFWFMLIYSGTIFPFQIYLIPIFKGFRSMQLYDTPRGMILFYTAICIPFSMFVLRNFFLGVSREIVEHAKIDGAKDLQILLKIFLPISKAPVSIIFLSQFTWVWNDLMFGITFTKTSTVRPVMAAISLMGKDNVPVLLTACIVVSIPTIVLFVLLQKNLEVGFAYQSK